MARSRLKTETLAIGPPLTINPHLERQNLLDPFGTVPQACPSQEPENIVGLG